MRLGGQSIRDVSAMPVGAVRRFLAELRLEGAEKVVASRVLDEVDRRLGFLEDVGLDYLGLDRASATLSGGESQRIALAAALGTGLVGTLFVLDEPSVGLHPRDTDRLIGILKALRDQGNTVVVVEHDTGARGGGRPRDRPRARARASRAAAWSTRARRRRSQASRAASPPSTCAETCGSRFRPAAAAATGSS